MQDRDRLSLLIFVNNSRFSVDNSNASSRLQSSWNAVWISTESFWKIRVRRMRSWPEV